MYTSVDKNCESRNTINPEAERDRYIERDRYTEHDRYTDRDRYLRTAFRYLAASIAIAVFGAIYEHFSFGVWSGFMVYAFMIPLTGGTLTYMLRYLRSAKQARRFADGCTGKAPEDEWVWHAGIITLTAGSIVHGILAICGRPNHLTVIYLIAGLALLATAVIMRVLSKRIVSGGREEPSVR